MLNPLRTRRFAEEELQRTKTDAIDALGIARFAAQKRPPPARLPDVRRKSCVIVRRATGSSRTSRAVSGSYIERLTWAFQSSLGMCARSRASSPPPFCRATQLRRRFVVLGEEARSDRLRQCARDREELARALIEAAANSVGVITPNPPIADQYLYEDLDVLRRQLKDLARDIEGKLDDHEVGKLLTTIDGVGPLTAACLIAELGDPARFRSAGAIASYVGVAPRLRQSGKKRFFSGSPTIPLGNARLRKALWMVVLNAVRCNPWLRQYYERLRAAGKPGKVAVIAAMRKLLAAVWSVAKHRRPFVPRLPFQVA